MAVMQLLAVADLLGDAAAGDLPYNVTLLSVSSEEAGGASGAQLVAERFLDRLRPAVVVGEGGAGLSGVLASDPHRAVFGIEIAQKSGLQLRLSLRVDSPGHGSVPPEEYASKEMILALDRLITRRPKVRITPPAALMFRELGKQERGLRGLAMRHAWLLRLVGGRYLRKEPMLAALVTNTVTVTSLSTPLGNSNQIAQRVTATLDCRLLPGTPQGEFIRELQRTLSDRDLEVEVLSGFVQATSSAPGNPFFGRLRGAVLAVHPEALVVPILFPASNDNNYFRSRGIPAFGLLPVYLTEELLHTIHNTDERIPVAALESGTEVYKRFLRSVQGTGVAERAEASPSVRKTK
jgi:carboxypeptidase PM20D1